MKKIYALSMGLLLGTTGMVAQNLNWGDFEDGTKGIWGQDWGGTITIGANPTNPSEKSLFFTSAGTYQGPVINWENAGVITQYYSALEVDVYPLSDGKIQFVLMNSAAGGATVNISKDVTANSWQHLTFDLTTLSAYDYKQLALQFSIQANCHYDNITLVSTNANPYTFDNFSILNNWSGYGATNTCEADPTNNSIKALKSVASEVTDWSMGISKDYATKPVVGKKPLKIMVKVYNTAACTNFKLELDGALTTSNTDKVELYQAITTTNQWVELVYDFSTTIKPTWDYSKITLAPKEVGTFYIGSIVIEYPASTAIAPNTNALVNIFAADGSINIEGAEGATVDVYSLTGVKMSSAIVDSSYSVNVAAGIYIVTIDGISTKVIVK